jgi:hypothetical protein
LVLVGAGLSSTTGRSASVGFVPPIRHLTRGDVGGYLVEVAAGTGGERASAGIAVLYPQGRFTTSAFTLSVTASRTSRTPTAGTPHATYLGTEMNVMFAGVRFGVGVDGRVAGGAAHAPGRFRFVWSVGYAVPIGD